MRWFVRARKAEAPAEAAGPAFGAWVLEQFLRGEQPAFLPFAQLERACSNAASLVCGAVYGRPGAFDAAVLAVPGLAGDAGTIARRTADGFKAALADREHTVLAWPWEHIGTMVAWRATRAGELETTPLGSTVERVATAYALRHREQLTAVLDLWGRVAEGVYRGEQRPDLVAMGLEMLRAFEAARGKPAGGGPAG
ncbi:hypothetical protein [Tepidiforma sp.]|uniref:hypothetical protein n=1 Tax=Tepidiforma sp. TaxID=2682230 RepID=UPI002ADD61F3|nr:hypothetical protein [Tepidiforma sp.]